MLYLSSAGLSRYVGCMNQFALHVSPLVVLMFVASITPGPNNLMLMLAGTRFGFMQTVPHLLGVTTGTVLVICLTYCGLGALMLGHPRLVNVMTLACGAYLLWLASRLIRPEVVAQDDVRIAQSEEPVRRPMRAVEAILFQFVNPKVWTMALAATSIAARFPFSPAASIAVVATTTAVVNSPCIALWAAFGKVMRRRLDNARTRRWFDGSMAALVVVTAIWIVWPVLTR
jgi:threonine/homoserine/homoserine lactone efflux protein